MAEDDIVVRIGADTSDLDAKMARAQQMMQQGFTPAPYGLGGPPQSLLERATEKAKTQTPEERDAAVRKYAQAAKEATGATNQLSEAENGLAQSSDRAASGFERMVGRMLTRLVVFGLLFEAIRLIKEVLQESTAYETAQVRFENLSVAVEGSAKAWEHLRQVAHETGISQEDLGQAQMSLEKMGVSGGEVGGVMENLAKYAKILGVDIGTVAEEFGRVELKQGSIKDMQDLAYATHDINLQQLVNDLAETQRMAPLVAQQQAEIDKQINRAAEDTDRLRQAQIGVAEAMHLAGKAYQQFIGGGSAGGVAGQLTGRLQGELAVGAAQLAAEGGPSVQQMREMGVKGKEIYQILMQAAERYHERVRELMKRQEEDARENVRLKAARDLIAAEDKVAQAIEKGIGANTAFAKVMATAEGLSDLIKEHIQEIVDDAKDINDAIKGWNSMILNFMENLDKAGKMIMGILDGLNKLVSWNPNVPEYGIDLSRTEAGRKMSGLPEPSYHHVPGYISGRHEPTAADKFNEMTKKQDEQKKEQQDANKKLDQIHGVLQQAFGT